jgi:hypothetical protein
MGGGLAGLPRKKVLRGLAVQDHILEPLHTVVGRWKHIVDVHIIYPRILVHPCILIVLLVCVWIVV